MNPFLVLALTLASLIGVFAQAPNSHEVDWAKLRGEILERYRALVQMDTTAGHEILAVDYLKKMLEGGRHPHRRPSRSIPIVRTWLRGSKATGRSGRC